MRRNNKLTSPVLDLAEEVSETFPACYTAKRRFYGDFIKTGRQKAPEFPIDLNLCRTPNGISMEA